MYKILLRKQYFVILNTLFPFKIKYIHLSLCLTFLKRVKRSVYTWSQREIHKFVKFYLSIQWLKSSFKSGSFHPLFSDSGLLLSRVPEFGWDACHRSSVRQAGCQELGGSENPSWDHQMWCSVYVLAQRRCSWSCPFVLCLLSQVAVDWRALVPIGIMSEDKPCFSFL